MTILDSPSPIDVDERSDKSVAIRIETSPKEILRQKLGQRRTIILALIWLWGVVLCLDRLTTYSYQTIATNSFDHHSELALLNVIRAIVAAAAGPPFAVLADLGGRNSAFIVGMLLYTAGHATLASATSIPHYIGGATLYEIGANGILVAQQVLIADLTSSRDRLFAQILPQTPFMIFAFVSSKIYSAILANSTWRWGVGMFSILGPAALLPLVSILWWDGRAIRRNDSRRPDQILKIDSNKLHRLATCCLQIVRLADMLGLLFLTTFLSLFLIPLTLAAASPDRWGNADIITELALGGLFLFVFLLWEFKFAPHPFMPARLFLSRSFWAGALVQMAIWTGNQLMTSYLPTYLYVVKGVSTTQQQNISVLYSFTCALVSLPVALVARFTRRLKGLSLFGLGLLTVGMGIMTSFRGHSTSLFQIIASQIILGLGGAFAVATIQTNVQVTVPLDQVAQSIACLNIFNQMGVAAGSAAAGTIWTNFLPSRLSLHLSSATASELAAIFASPLTWITTHALGTTERDGVIGAYQDVQRVLMIAATTVCGLAFILGFLLRDPKLNDDLCASLVESKDEGDREKTTPQAEKTLRL